jgi:hypothetical protein
MRNQPGRAFRHPLRAPSPAQAIGSAALASLLVVAAFGNAAAYIGFAGNPLVASDSWAFLNLFLQKAMDEGPGLADFWVKRDALDHAQPVVKGLLWFNASWLGLDFVFEAFMGLAFAAATWAFLVLTARREGEAEQPPLLRALAAGALAASLVTLNSGMVFNWSLVSLTFIPYLLAVIAAFAAWRAFASGRFGLLVVASLLVAFLLDDVGVIISAALLGAVLLAAARSGEWRRGAAVAGVVVTALVAYQLVARLAFDPVPAAPRTGVESIAWLWEHRAEWPTMFQVAFGSTLAHINPLLHYFPDTAGRWQAALAVLVVLAHLWFWWRAWHDRWNAASFHAVVIMLMFYAFAAGVLYARVPAYGTYYLNEPRYVAFYLLSNVALVLMLMARPIETVSSRRGVVSATAMGALIALQVPLSQFTWYEGRFLHSYYHTMAAQMFELGEGRVPEACVPLLTVCQMPAEERQKAMQVLRRHELNVFAPDFIARYGLQRLVPAASTAVAR